MWRVFVVLLLSGAACTGLFLENPNTYPCDFAAGPGVRKIQYLWLVECYGEVARMTSRDGEVDPDFASAVEFRRLGIGL